MSLDWKHHSVVLPDRVIVLLLEAFKFGAKLAGNFFVSGFSVQVVHFHRIGLQVEQFLLIYVSVEANEFVPFRSHSIMTPYGMFTGIFVVMIIQGFSPISGSFFVFE